LRHEIELRLGRADEDELHRNAAHRRRDRRAGGGCVIDRSADERLQTDGAADQDRFDIEPFVAVKTFYVGDPERRLGDRDRGDREAYFFTLREERRCCEEKGEKDQTREMPAAHANSLTGSNTGKMRLSIMRGLLRYRPPRLTF